MPGEVQRHQVMRLQMRRQRGKTRGIVEPAMQGQYRLVCRIAERQRGQFTGQTLQSDGLNHAGTGGI